MTHAIFSAGARTPVLLDHSDSGLSPAQHRLAVAASDKCRADPVLSWPTLSRLHKAGEQELAAALALWCELSAPAAMGAANDNYQCVGVSDGVHMEEFSSATAAMGEDGEWEVRPTVQTTLRAANDAGPFPARVSVTTTKSKTSWSRSDRRVHNRLIRAPYPQHEFHFYGRLLFGPTSGRNPKGGNWQSNLCLIGIVERDKRGSWKKGDGRWNIKHRPSETWRRDRGAPKIETPAAPYYLIPGVAVLQGAEFIAMAPRTIPAPANDNDAAADIIRTIDAAALRKQLGQRDVDLLDLAASPMTATEIGQHFGYYGQYARRWAVKATDEAIRRFVALN